MRVRKKNRGTKKTAICVRSAAFPSANEASSCGAVVSHPRQNNTVKRFCPPLATSLIGKSIANGARWILTAEWKVDRGLFTNHLRSVKRVIKTQRNNNKEEYLERHNKQVSPYTVEHYCSIRTTFPRAEL